jgi:hypothetical protein
MRPAKSAQGEEQGELYQRRLSTLLDQRHPLYVLAEAIDSGLGRSEHGQMPTRVLTVLLLGQVNIRPLMVRKKLLLSGC